MVVLNEQSKLYVMLSRPISSVKESLESAGFASHEVSLQEQARWYSETCL